MSLARFYRNMRCSHLHVRIHVKAPVSTAFYSTAPAWHKVGRLMRGLREPPSAHAGVAILTEKKDGKAAPGPNCITVGGDLAMELVRVTEVTLNRLHHAAPLAAELQR